MPQPFGTEAGALVPIGVDWGALRSKFKATLVPVPNNGISVWFTLARSSSGENRCISPIWGRKQTFVWSGPKKNAKSHRAAHRGLNFRVGSCRGVHWGMPNLDDVGKA